MSFDLGKLKKNVIKIAYNRINIDRINIYFTLFIVKKFGILGLVDFSPPEIL